MSKAEQKFLNLKFLIILVKVFSKFFSLLLFLVRKCVLLCKDILSLHRTRPYFCHLLWNKVIFQLRYWSVEVLWNSLYCERPLVTIPIYPIVIYVLHNNISVVSSRNGNTIPCTSHKHCHDRYLYIWYVKLVVMKTEMLFCISFSIKSLLKFVGSIHSVLINFVWLD